MTTTGMRFEMQPRTVTTELTGPSSASVSSGDGPASASEGPPAQLDMLARRRRGTISRSAETVAKIIEELTLEYEDVVSQSVITAFADQAVRDLKGSICVEALPEMAIRLARVRLDAR